MDLLWAIYLNVKHYREVPNDANITHIRFGVKAKGDAFLLLSENPPNSIDTSTDHDYVEVVIGGWLNMQSNIR